jgi:type IV pilus assembly protein PilV
MKKFHTRRPPAVRARRSAARGFMLIEALVAILIFSFGILGLIGLQANMTKAQTSSKFRGDAAYLAQQLIGSMWADLPNMASYASANCSAYTRCADWVAKRNATLPSSTSTVAVNVTTGEVSITITWNPPDEGTHRYAITTSVRG